MQMQNLLRHITVEKETSNNIKRSQTLFVAFKYFNAPI